MSPAPDGWPGGLLCLAAIYLPCFLLVVGTLPFWAALRRRVAVQSVLKGVNAAVVGILLAALYRPVWTSAILAPDDVVIGLLAFLLLAFWRVPPWLVVILGAAGAEAVGVLR
jgi:chromate transporter